MDIYPLFIEGKPNLSACILQNKGENLKSPGYFLLFQIRQGEFKFSKGN